MKNYLSHFLNGKLGLQIISMVFLSLFLVSCEKEEVDQPAELTVYDVLAKGAPAPGDNTIVGIAASNEDFEVLVAALQATGLAPLFQGDDQFTVFAPTDDAFKKLAGYDDIENPSTQDILTKLVNTFGVEAITNVLTYHVTDGRRASNSVVPPRNFRIIETLFVVEGESATFRVNTSATILANNSTANFVSADLINISASNGIIHVIDTVLLP